MRIVLMNVSLFVITTMANVKHKTGFNTYNIDGGYDFGDQHDLIIITLAGWVWWWTYHKCNLNALTSANVTTKLTTMMMLTLIRGEDVYD